jgi:hypothetical protein
VAESNRILLANDAKIKEFISSHNKTLEGEVVEG